MLKPASLREHLHGRLPQLRRDPEKLVVFIAAWWPAQHPHPVAGPLNTATPCACCCSTAAHADAVMALLLIWLRTHQPDLLDNPESVPNPCALRPST